MQNIGNVVLVIHLILALSLIGIVLLQRSEGGGLGIGGGSGGGIMSARGAATALGKATWIIAGAFIATSIALTIIAAEKSAGSSVLDRITDQPVTIEEPTATDTGTVNGADLLPPTAAESGPIVPVLPTAPAETAPAPATDPATTTDPVATTAPAATN